MDARLSAINLARGGARSYVFGNRVMVPELAENDAFLPQTLEIFVIKSASGSNAHQAVSVTLKRRHMITGLATSTFANIINFVAFRSRASIPADISDYPEYVASLHTAARSIEQQGGDPLLPAGSAGAATASVPAQLLDQLDLIAPLPSLHKMSETAIAEEVADE
jgi:hypothetical protein